MWISGLHTIRAYLEHKPESIKVLYLLSTNKTAQEVATIAREKGVTTQWTNKPVVEQGKHLSQGVGAKCKPYEYIEEHDLESLLTPNGITLILDSVQDPQNLGACIRTADATNLDCIIIGKDNAASVTETVAKAATGAIATVPIIRVTNLTRVIEKLKSLGVWVYGAATEERATNIYKTQFPKDRSVAMVMGSEGLGIRRLIKEACDELIVIPMQGTVQSLNVSVATALCVYEIRRQQQESTGN